MIEQNNLGRFVIPTVADPGFVENFRIRTAQVMQKAYLKIPSLNKNCLKKAVYL